MISMVSRARASGLATKSTASRLPMSFFSTRPLRAAWVRPVSFKGTAIWPCKRCAAFQSVSPWRTKNSVRPGRTRSHLEHQLAVVAAGIEQIQDLRKRVEPAFAHILAQLEKALAVPSRELADGLGNPVRPVEHNQALDAKALGQHEAKIFRALRRLGGIVSGDQAAERNATKRVHLSQHGVEDFAGDILEVDVDA